MAKKIKAVKKATPKEIIKKVAAINKQMDIVIQDLKSFARSEQIVNETQIIIHAGQKVKGAYLSLQNYFKE